MRVLDTAIQTGLAIAVLTLCAPAQAVTLVHPDGTLVGGKWQRWANQALVPTVRGPLIFEPTAEFGCGGADACSMRSPGPGEPATTAASDQPGLYFELGHQFDWTYLTNADRGRFARMWGRPHHPWVDSVASVMSLLVRRGIGISLLPADLFTEDLAAGALKILLENSSAKDMEYSAAYLRASDNPLVPQLAALAREESWFVGTKRGRGDQRIASTISRF